MQEMLGHLNVTSMPQAGIGGRLDSRKDERGIKEDERRRKEVDFLGIVALLTSSCMHTDC